MIGKIPVSPLLRKWGDTGEEDEVIQKQKKS
jgi:hypothetical protein